MPRTVTTVLFDLDGTLLDTAPDLAAAVNRVLREEGRDALPLEYLRPVVSAGASAMLVRAFGNDQDETLFQQRLRLMLDFYRNNIAQHTRLFDGMAQVLERLEALGRPWGVVTNKPAWLTEPLMEALQLAQRSGCIVSGDTVAEKKPHPMPMLEACRRINSRPECCVYVGDADRDIAAGRAAGMKTLAAAYGYVPEGDDPNDWGADALLHSPLDLLAWLERHGATA
ncbi:phosphoglycolate phosphatase [Methylogaea oryzae]|uniref:Phosphoglycolate phosphatase, bacterial n=1 Tax=Methylogaea oryzae TaxID=1295382 RepID=A0A8D5AJM6_9GAMM|nr:phosphoglycolate phosphatase [Methylogaea oryzae]BBL70216.1 phosphoglycolate phosphatase, bacterial [Methylogaea oryzae]